MSEPRSPSLRIWQIAESYPPEYGGGAAIVIRDICHALADLGHDVRVLSTERREVEPYTTRVDRDGPIEVCRVNLPYFRSTDPDGWQLGFRKWRQHERRVAGVIDRSLEQWSPDLVVYSTCRPLGEEGVMAIRRHGLPIVAMLHEAWLICPRIMLLRSPTDSVCSGPGPVKCNECMYSNYDGSHSRAVLKMSWRIPRLGAYPAYRIRRRRKARGQVCGAVAVSEFMTEAHRSHFPGPVIHVPFGIDLAGLPAKRPERPRDPLRFGFMGGFQPNKGAWDLLDAAAGLKADGLEFELHVWGPGQEEARAEIQRRALEDRVSLEGMYDGQQLWDAYDAIDVALMPTVVPEPLGRIPLEAAAVGVPTIGADVGGIRESIADEINGLLFRFKDAADLQRQMRRIVEEPSLYRTLSQGLTPPVDTRTRGAAVEAAYRRILAAASGNGS